MVGKPLITSFMDGLPPHIAQVICGHRDISTTMGYKAIYPAEAIEAHRAFITRRRQARPSEEYRTPTEEEWDQFLAHFEKRKLSIGICARAFGTPCIHEHEPASGARSCGQTQPSAPGWKRSASTCMTASPKPNARAGPAKPKA
jgi:hypothetical protein